MTTTYEDNVVFRGTATFLGATNIPAGTITDAMVAAAAGVAYSKLEHQHRCVVAQESDTSAADETHVAHVVVGTAGTLLEFKIGAVVANVGAAVVDVDLLKNGVSVLSAPVQIDNGDAAYALVAGTISDTTLAAGDVLEVDIDGTIGGGTLAKGVFAYIDLKEDAA